MRKLFEGKVAVITGGARGLGGATAPVVVREGGSVVIADVEVEQGQALADELGDAAVFVECDVTKEDQIARAVDAAPETFGRLDAVWANAGIMGPLGGITELSMDDFARTLAVNTWGSVCTVKHAARVLLAQGEGGAIVMTSSCAALQGGLSPHTYTASKGALSSLVRSLSSELVGKGIRVNAIAPGPVPTPMTSLALTGSLQELDEAARQIAADWSPIGRAPRPSIIGEAFLFLASDWGNYISGITLPVDAGLVNGSPTGQSESLGASIGMVAE